MSLSKNKTSYNYIFGGQLDVYGKLKVSNTLEATGGIKITNTIGSATLNIEALNTQLSGIQFSDGDETLGQIYYFHVDNSLRFTNNGSENLSILGNGNIGIGSENPQRTLDVVGSIRKTEYEPGEIIETLVGVCDGNPVTVKSGTYTLENVNSDQVLNDNHTVISGSSINYVPPAGTTRVCYEFWVYMKDTGSGNNSRPLLHFQSQLEQDDNNPATTMTTINNSRHTWRYTHPVDLMDVQTWIYNKVIVSIGQVSSDNISNGRLASWNNPRIFRWRARRYNSSYGAQFHETNHYDGSGSDIRVRPHVKITAIA